MFNDHSSATSSRSVAKLSSVTMAPSIARMNVFSRNCGMYCRMPRRSVSFTSRLLQRAAGRETLRFHREAGKLPEVSVADRRRAPLREQLRTTLERRPVRPNRGTAAQIRTGAVDIFLSRQDGRNQDAPCWCADHEHADATQ